jgi:hypothetical protein
MALNQNLANSTADVEKFSKSLDSILDSLKTPGSVQEVLNIATTSFGKRQIQIRPILSEMVNNVDRPLLKQMAQDVVTVMSNWFEDPQTLCCLVQGLFAIFNATRDVTLADTDFAKWMDVLIAFVDVIIVFLSSNIKKLSLAIPDFLKEIMNGVIGAILLILQEILYTIRDSLINELLRLFDSNAKTDQIWAKCLPLMDLIEILRKYISDYGLFAELFQKIKGFIGNMVGNFGYMKALDFPQNFKDLEFLYWFRELLLKLKLAALSFDLCFLPQDAATGGMGQQFGTDFGKTWGVGPNPAVIAGTGLQKRAGSPEDLQGIKITPDGTILEDKVSLKKNSLSVLTNSSVRGFLNKYYGYPLEVVDSLMVGSTSADSIQGSLTGGNPDINADCPNSPTPADAIKWALRVRNRNI